MEILKRTGKLVKLSIVRYLRGLKFEELQEGITQANVATPTSPYPQTPVTPHSSHDDLLLGVEERLNATSQVMVSSFYLFTFNLVGNRARFLKSVSLILYMSFSIHSNKLNFYHCSIKA